ncbi:unnamed protein product [Lymnaea stagnalis]|uniref:Leucine-rich PPR motif-containing protein, mitochondrial n=1 Tax=Lymnaea stagnalis TaxID=6523 RepID=A0AAV2I7U4_LYMST
MAALMRCGVLRHRNLVQSLASLFPVTNNYGVKSPCLWRSAGTYPQLKNKDELLIQVHKKMDYNQGISTDMFQSLYSSLEKFDNLTENDMGVLLHICSIGPYDSPTANRLALVDKIWSSLDAFGVKPTTKLYNVKLKTYCANKKMFNPLDELMTMKSLGLNPDKVTYGLLVEGFCQRGDIAGANTVLEAMQSSDYLLGLNIFNSFITGHLKAGSPEEAVKVLELLRSKGLEPDSDTYLRYALHYAEEGDIDSVMKYITEADSAGVTLQQSLLLELYRVMNTSGHGNKAGQLLKHLSEGGVFRSNVVQKSCQLISEGYNDAALELYLTMPRVEEGILVYKTGSFLLKTMIINGQGSEEVMSMADKILELYPGNLCLKNALLYAYKAKRTELAVQLLESMHTKNHNIKVAYLLPAICDYRKSNNKEGIYKTVGMLLELTSGEDMYEQLLHCAYPALSAINESREDIILNFKNHEKTWNTVFFCADLVEKGFNAAFKNAEGKELAPLNSILVSSLTSATKNYLFQEWETCVSILHWLNGLPGIDKTMIKYTTGEFVRYLVVKENFDVAGKFLDALQKKQLKLMSGFPTIKVLDGIPKNIKDKIRQVCSVPHNGPIEAVEYFDYKEFDELTKETFDKRRAKVHSKSFSPSNEAVEYFDYKEFDEITKERFGKREENVRTNSFSPSIELLNKAMENNDLVQIKQNLQQLEATGFKIKPFHLTALIIKFLNLGDVESATSYFEQLKTTSEGKYSQIVPLRFGAELVKKGDLDGALNMIQIASKSQLPKDNAWSYAISEAIEQMLKNSSTIMDAEKLHQAIVNSNIVKDNEALRVHRWFVSRIISEDDDDELIRQLKALHEKHKVFPALEMVLERFISKKDVEKLKQVMDLGIGVFGANYFHHCLAISFIRCGLPNKAAVILQTPGLKLNQNYILDSCQYFIKAKKIDCLSALVDITKSMPISRSALLQQLAQGYIAVGDLKKATDVLQQFTEDFSKPPKPLLQQLVIAHRNANVPLPELLQVFLKDLKPNNKGRPDVSSDVSKPASDFTGQEDQSSTDVSKSEKSPELDDNKK